MTSKLNKMNALQDDDKKQDLEVQEEFLLSQKSKQSFSKRIIVPEEEKIETSCSWRLCCCCYYLFCCCLCESGGIKITKNKFVDRFEKWLNMGHHTQRGQGDIMALLIRLYAHDKSAIKDLEQVRVNPDFTSQFRNDLEFFIPQLCSFYLKGETDYPEELVNLIVMASTSSFFFSHRIWFFFQSMIFGADISSKQQFKKSKVALKGIKDACIKTKERLYLSNSKDLLKLIQEFNLIELYPQLKEQIVLEKKEEEARRQTEQISMKDVLEIIKKNQNSKQAQRLERVKQIIDEYSDNNTSYSFYHAGKEQPMIFINNQEEAKDLNEGSPQLQVEPEEQEAIQITAKDIILPPYMLDNDISYKESLLLNLAENKGSDMKQFNSYALNAYLSTPKFVTNLTDISLEIINQTNRDEFLKEELKKVNKMLPAAVYIPFVNDSIRNYAILHIVADEAKIFQTKERAPLLLCLEAFRPEELMLLKPEKPIPIKGKKKKGNHYLKKTNEKEVANYRSQSWNSSYMTENSENRTPLIQARPSHEQLINPYQPPDATNKAKKLRKSMKVNNKEHQGVLGLGEQFVARISMKKKNQQDELMRLSKAGENIEVIKDKANKLFDEKASDPLTINNLRKSDSVMDKVKMNENYFQTYLKQASGQFDFQFQGKQKLQFQPIPEEEKDEFEEQINSELVNLNDPNAQFFQSMQQKKKSSQTSTIQPTYQSKDQINYLNNQDAKFSNLEANQNYQSYALADGSRETISKEHNSEAKTNEKENGEKMQSHDTKSGRLGFKSIEESNKEDEEEHAEHPTPFIMEPQIESHLEQQLNHEQQEVSNGNLTADKQIADQQTRSFSMRNPKSKSDANNELFFESQNKLFIQEDSKQRDTVASNAAFYQDRPNNTVFLETSIEQDERVRKNSPFGNLKTWKLIKIIVKSNDDVRQEQFAMQLISQIDQIFKLKKLNLWLKPYEILATGPRCGLIEVVQDALSIDSIKKKMGIQTRLIDYFNRQFGDSKTKKFKKARINFCKSLAAYSLVCYVMQIKDRHNGNILVDIEGHIMHIDFGFLLSNAPGKGIKFEQAPFKLTDEMVEVLGGNRSKKFKEYRELMRLGFMAIQEHADKVITLVEMMFMGQNDLPCFALGENLIRELKQRVLPTGHLMNEIECAKYVDNLIDQSYNNWRTRAYDKFQYCCQGIV